MARMSQPLPSQSSCHPPHSPGSRQDNPMQHSDPEALGIEQFAVSPRPFPAFLLKPVSHRQFPNFNRTEEVAAAVAFCNPKALKPSWCNHLHPKTCRFRLLPPPLDALGDLGSSMSAQRSSNRRLRECAVRRGFVQGDFNILPPNGTR